MQDEIMNNSLKYNKSGSALKKKWHYILFFGIIVVFVFFIYLFYFTNNEQEIVIESNKSFYEGGYTLSPGLTLIIDEYDTCKKLINNGNSTYFISTKTSAEWSSFQRAASSMSDISISDC